MLGVTFSSDLSLDKPDSGVCAACFSSNPMSMTVTGRWVHKDTGIHLCHSLSGLLQHTCQLSRICDRQTAMGAECCSMPRPVLGWMQFLLTCTCSLWCIRFCTSSLWQFTGVCTT